MRQPVYTTCSFAKVTSRKNPVWMKAKQKNQYLSFIAILLLLSNINIRDNILIFSTTKTFLKSLSGH